LTHLRSAYWFKLKLPLVLKSRSRLVARLPGTAKEKESGVKKSMQIYIVGFHGRQCLARGKEVFHQIQEKPGSFHKSQAFQKGVTPICSTQ
jgi:hypothetical protein